MCLYECVCVCVCYKTMFSRYYCSALTLCHCRWFSILSARWCMQPEGDKEIGLINFLATDKDRLNSTPLISFSQPHPSVLAQPISKFLHPIHIWRYWTTAAKTASSAWNWDWRGNPQRPNMGGWGRERMKQLRKTVYSTMSRVNIMILFMHFCVRLYGVSPSWRRREER